MRWFKVLGLVVLPAVNAVASTDSLQDTDPANSGYLTNHNIDPAAVPNYTLKWRMTYNTNEAFYAKPLVWTPPGGTVEQVITVSNQNNIRILDSTSGATINSRTLDPPFLSSDSMCGDIPNTIGIISTPIIDPATNIMYLISKGYIGGASSGGAINGQDKFYAVQLPGLTDVPGFPTIISGNADNDPTRYFIAGTLNQRPSLNVIGNTIIAGFGGHCDNFNYTGMALGISKTTGDITAMMAMMASPGAPSPQPLNILTQNGGKAGIWQSGTGLAVDSTNSRVFFVTGNGIGNGDNAAGAPASGKTHISTLEQATVDVGVSANGAFTQQDYFAPYEYASLNGGDRDFGSSGACLLDPYFSGGGVNRIIVAGGKTGKIYVMNADNLGGFNTAAGGGDGVLQTIQQPLALLSGVASYPAEGGYIYFAPSAGPLYAYSFGMCGGVPCFTLAGQTAMIFAGRGAPTVTSLNGKAGSGIVWMADVNDGIVAFNAVPVNGALVQITSPATGRLQKMQRPAFGNAAVYSSEVNEILAIGGTSTVTEPSLQCAPNSIAFGSVVDGTTSVVQLTCTVGTNSMTIKSATTGLHIFQYSGLPTGTLAAGSSFTIPVTINLTSAALENTRVIDGVQIVPGTESSILSFVDSLGFTTTVSLSGKVVASGGFPVITPYTLEFGSSTVGQTVAKTFTVTNDGAGTLVLTSFAWTDPKVTNPPSNSVVPGGSTIIGKDFTSSDFPVNGATIASGATITIAVNWSPSVAGVGSALLTFTTNGGVTDIMFTGTAAACTTCTSSSMLASPSSSSASPSSLSLLSSSSSLSAAQSSSTLVLLTPTSSSLLVSWSSSLPVPQSPSTLLLLTSTSSSSLVSSSSSLSVPQSSSTLGLLTFTSSSVTALTSSSLLSIPSSTGSSSMSSLWSSSASSSLRPSSTLPSSIMSTSSIVSSSLASSSLQQTLQSTSTYIVSTGLSTSTKGTSSSSSTKLSTSSTSKISSSSSTKLSSSSSTAKSSSSSSTKLSTSSSTAKSSSLSSTKLSTSSSSVKSTTSSKSSSTVGPSSVKASTTKSTSSFVTMTKSSSVTVATQTGAYNYLGCYQEVSNGKVLPLLLANDTITPQVCESLVLSLAAKPTPTHYPYYYVEYHRECYAGSSLNFGTAGVTSVTGAHACTDVCSGSVGATSTGTAFCGGWAMFDLYATGGSSLPFVPATTQSV
ncbi:uncharacterized protein LY89DRAFT_412163 [Mollisia scopiformis]|uniref:WSC domain-containing protein n=1 Tax=Mollisia scopiformis TaxID=149040 RepID=A0A132B201_MOLSC|nr:uncharacterized protein LY89DRAFT_412163 [Mollisia scopiformis]KUJ06410.1 hypothetical protein LY89DRAFT_412163 [Mollisia scopiformis]